MKDHNSQNEEVPSRHKGKLGYQVEKKEKTICLYLSEAEVDIRRH